MAGLSGIQPFAADAGHARLFVRSHEGAINPEVTRIGIAQKKPDRSGESDILGAKISAVHSGRTKLLIPS